MTRKQSNISQACLCAAVAVVAAACVLLGPGAGRARADKASAALEKYRKPVDEAIDKALAFLARNQLTQKDSVRQGRTSISLDGSFASTLQGNTGITSLCVMAFLSKGHTPGTGPYGDVIDRGIDYILSSQRTEDGLLVGPRRTHGVMYSHGISTLLLSEVSGMVDKERQKKIDKVLPRALRLIMNAQARRKPTSHYGGWRYNPTSSDSDISCTGWQLMALKSARNNGAGVPRANIDTAVKYILRCRTTGGGFSYQPGGGAGLARTGTGVLCLEICGRRGHKAATDGGEWMLRNLPVVASVRRGYGGTHFFYGMYYCSQAMFQLGGKYWEKWAAAMYEVMLKHQVKGSGKKRTDAEGSWPGGRGGSCYSTAMGVLAMAVSYRQLPIYQR